MARWMSTYASDFETVAKTSEYTRKLAPSLRNKPTSARVPPAGAWTTEYHKAFEEARVGTDFVTASEREATAAADRSAAGPVSAFGTGMAERYDENHRPRSPEVFAADAGLHGVSSAKLDFGPPGTVPALLVPDDPRDITPCASTIDLAAGTPRGSAHIPGYTGFIPAAGEETQTAAVIQARGTTTRPNTAKTSAILNLDKTRVPGLATYRPSSPSFERTLEEARSLSDPQANKGAALFATAYRSDFAPPRLDAAAAAKATARSAALYKAHANPWNRKFTLA